MANTANCDLAIGATFADVGSYPGSGSPSGTFDQGGNAEEWTEATILRSRVFRGGNDFDDETRLAASNLLAARPGQEQALYVASVVPEPGTGLLLMTGLLAAARWGRQGSCQATAGGGVPCHQARFSSMFSRVH